MTPVPSPLLAIRPSGLATVTFDDPDRKVNVLTEEVLDRLGGILDELESAARTGEVRGVLFRSGRRDSFIAGADLDAIGAVDDPSQGARASRFGQELFLRVERLPVPTLAAIHGSCLGGGLELALACSHRVASDSPRTGMSLPEVRLGILPAWGGTTRLPRLVGLRAALPILLTGRTVRPREAARIGLVDEVLPAAGFDPIAQRRLTGALEGTWPSRRPPRSLWTRALEGSSPGRRLLLGAARRSVLARTGGHYPAPLRILDVVGEGSASSAELGYALESDAAGELLASEVASHLLHVFRLREGARKGHGVDGGRDGPEVRRIGVVGAGIMGGGIAQLAAAQDLPVRLRDLESRAIGAALRHARERFDDEVRRGRMEEGEAARRFGRIGGGTEPGDLRGAELVVEAVVERIEVKQKVLAGLEDEISPSCILATNTSSLSVDRLGSGLRHPERFLGLHFFNPVHRMPLVEIVRGASTEPAAVGRAYRLVLRLGKVPVLVTDGPGFLVNRILGPYLNEAGFLVQDGAPIEEVDAAATAFGMPMGPFRLMDEIGLGVVRLAGAALHQGLGERLAPAPPLAALGESGREGRRAGTGIYRYDEKGKPRGLDPEGVAALQLPPEPAGSPPDEEEARERLVLIMVSEAARVLEEGIVATASAVDLGMIMGAGFPPFRGGLLRMADQHHPRGLVDRLRRQVDQGRERFAPPPLLLELAERDRSFHHAFPDRS